MEFLITTFPESSRLPLHAEIEERLGVLPGFFCLSPEAPEIAATLWEALLRGYLDNPLPSLFKERLFVYLSRFCEVRYSIIRHVGFLVGLGRPSGDPSCPPETVEQVIQLICRPLPRGDALEPHLTLLEGSSLPTGPPGPQEPGEEAIFACAAHVFLQTPQATRSLRALRRALGGRLSEHLAVLLTSVRTAHDWTRLHPELEIEEDVKELLRTHEALRACVLDDSESPARAGPGPVSPQSDVQTAALLDAIFENMPAMVFLKEARNLSFVRLNRAGEELIGLPRDAMIGRTDLDFFPAEQAAFFRQKDWETLASGLILDIPEEQLQTAHGPRWLHTRKVAVLDAKGQPAYLLGISTDIHDRRQAEEALKEADRKKDEFLATLAHELRNPLAPIRYGLHLIQLAEGDWAAVKKAGAMMERQVGHMVVLIDDLLDVSRITRGKVVLHRRLIELSVVIGNALEAVRPLVERYNHELLVALPREPLVLDADLTRLAQVLGNLLTNSVKYTPRGGSIWLTCERQGSELVMTVKDTGIGIPAAALERVFELFSQVDRSLEKTTGGLGIGLALVRGLVEMHGGTVSAYSEGEGKGSTFTVRLPLAQAPLPTAPAPLAQPPVLQRQILVVDDNVDAALALAELLRIAGHAVCTAHDGLTAVDAADAFRPELILMDVGMPRLNGLDATRRIREQPWGQSIRIFALTGWGQEGDRNQSAEAGCDEHLVKPVDPRSLEEMIARLPVGR